ncbi:MAG: ATP-binding protein [Thaumarchaeota archaeon]|nr:ATP-binding protein [Nitrososphaerota archaeon]
MVKDSDLRRANPWWLNRDGIQEDELIKEWENSTIKYDPRLRHKIVYDFEPQNTVVYTLRGPRQVGKSTLIKLQIRDFLKKGISPWNIFYYALDLAESPKEIVEVIEGYLQLTKRQRKEDRCYIFLDEASSVENWQKGVKWLIDGGRLPNCTLLASGSHAINIKTGTELLPGRKGKIEDNYDKVLIPMKFSEYATLLDKGIKNMVFENSLISFEVRKAIFTKLVNREIDERLDVINSHVDELNNIFQEYMQTGGTPKIVDEKLKTGTISEHLYTNYLDTFKGDWNKLGKKETLLKQFCGAIIKALGSRTSWNKLSQAAELGSDNTAQDYALTLKDLFLLTIIHMYGEEKKIPLIKKERKLYFHDPYFLHIFNGWMSPSDNFGTSEKFLEDKINQGRMAEQIVADHLIRWAFILSEKKQTFDYYNHVFYWEDGNNREVDFIFYDGKDIEVPIEVKYRNSIDPREFPALFQFFRKTRTKNGIVLSEKEFDVKSEYVVIPVSVFLMLI